MAALLKKSVLFGLGVSSILKERVKDWAEENRVLDRGSQEKEELRRLVKNQIQEAFTKLNIPTAQKIRELEARIENLERQKHEIQL